MSDRIAVLVQAAAALEAGDRAAGNVRFDDPGYLPEDYAERAMCLYLACVTESRREFGPRTEAFVTHDLEDDVTPEQRRSA